MPKVKIAKLRKDIRGLSLGCHDYASMLETSRTSKSLQAMVAVDRDGGWIVVLSPRPTGKRLP
jgi:hypothetical protein